MLNMDRNSPSASHTVRSKGSHRLQHRPYSGNFMRAEQIGFTQRSQHRKKGFRASHFFAEVFERVRQCMADRKTERPQPERIEKNLHLMAHALGAVLQVAIVKPQPRIEENSFHTIPVGQLDLAAK